MGGRAAERVGLVGAVDAGAVEDAHPARLQRVVRSGRDRRAGQVARPGAVGDVPGGVHRLVLDVVEAGRGVEADRADRDRVGLDQLELLVEAKLECVAVGDQHHGVLVGELRLGHLRPGRAHGRLHAARDARDGEGLGQPLAQHGRLDRDAVLLLDLVERGEVDLGVAGGLVEAARDALDECVDRVLVVGDPRRDLGTLLAAGEVARDAADDVALAALGERLVHHALDVGVHARVLGREAEALARVHDGDRLLERLAQLARDHVARLRDLHSAHVDTRDRDSLRDCVVARRVVRVCGHRASYEDQEENGDEDERPLPHASVGGSCRSRGILRTGSDSAYGWARHCADRDPRSCC